MKKLLALLLVIVMVFSVTGCGEKEKSNGWEEASYRGVQFEVRSDWTESEGDDPKYFYFDEDSFLMPTSELSDESVNSEEELKSYAAAFLDGLSESSTVDEDSVSEEIKTYNSVEGLYITYDFEQDGVRFNGISFFSIYDEHLYGLSFSVNESKLSDYEININHVLNRIAITGAEINPIVGNEEEINEEEPEIEETETKDPSNDTVDKFKKSDYKLIGYKKLARNPDKYIGKKITNTGTVVQLVEGDEENNIRIAIDDDYDKMMMIGYDPSIMKSRVLEDDTITFYGNYIGIYDYESTLGGNISVPAAYVVKIKIH